MFQIALGLLGMEIAPINLTDLLNLGGVFVLALIILYCHVKLTQANNRMLGKILTLLSILVKSNTNFNGVDSVLGKDSQKVLDHLQQAEEDHVNTP